MGPGQVEGSALGDTPFNVTALGHSPLLLVPVLVGLRGCLFRRISSCGRTVDGIILLEADVGYFDFTTSTSTACPITARL